MPLEQGHCEMTGWVVGPLTELAEQRAGRRVTKERALVIPA